MWLSRRAVLRPACSWRLSASIEIDKGGHQMPEIVTIHTPALGDRSYLIHDQTHAVVVDPQRDIDRVLAAAQAQQVRSRTCWRPTSTTTTSPAASLSPARPAPR